MTDQVKAATMRLFSAANDGGVSASSSKLSGKNPRWLANQQREQQAEAVRQRVLELLADVDSELERSHMRRGLKKSWLRSRRQELFKLSTKPYEDIIESESLLDRVAKKLRLKSQGDSASSSEAEDSEHSDEDDRECNGGESSKAKKETGKDKDTSTKNRDKDGGKDKDKKNNDKTKDEDKKAAKDKDKGDAKRSAEKSDRRQGVRTGKVRIGSSADGSSRGDSAGDRDSKEEGVFRANSDAAKQTELELEAHGSRKKKKTTDEESTSTKSKESDTRTKRIKDGNEKQERSESESETGSKTKWKRPLQKMEAIIKRPSKKKAAEKISKKAATTQKQSRSKAGGGDSEDDDDSESCNAGRGNGGGPSWCKRMDRVKERSRRLSIESGGSVDKGDERDNSGDRSDKAEAGNGFVLEIDASECDDVDEVALKELPVGKRRRDRLKRKKNKGDAPSTTSKAATGAADERKESGPIADIPVLEDSIRQRLRDAFTIGLRRNKKSGREQKRRQKKGRSDDEDGGSDEELDEKEAGPVVPVPASRERENGESNTGAGQGWTCRSSTTIVDGLQCITLED